STSAFAFSNDGRSTWKVTTFDKRLTVRSNMLIVSLYYDCCLLLFFRAIVLNCFESAAPSLKDTLAHIICIN
ncbi:hypothetical protein ACH2LM_004728, partial [Escherichia coli]